MEFIMTNEEAQAFADEWIAAWNSHDLDRVLSHYAPEVVLLSPIAQKLVGTGRVVYPCFAVIGGKPWRLCHSLNSSY